VLPVCIDIDATLVGSKPDPVDPAHYGDVSRHLIDDVGVLEIARDLQSVNTPSPFPDPAITEICTQ
jgi:hypothetical protein